MLLLLLVMLLHINHAVTYNDNNSHTPEDSTNDQGQQVWGYANIPANTLTKCTSDGPMQGDYMSDDSITRIEECGMGDENTHLIITGGGVVHDFGTRGHCEDVAHECVGKRVGEFGGSCRRVSANLEWSDGCANLVAAISMNGQVFNSLVEWCPSVDDGGRVGVTRRVSLNGQQQSFKEFIKVGQVGTLNKMESSGQLSQLLNSEETQAVKYDYSVVGGGKCLNMAGGDPKHKYIGNTDEQGCADLCDQGMDKCFGYSVSTHGNCLIWAERVQGGGEEWGGAHCHIKTGEKTDSVFAVILDDTSYYLRKAFAFVGLGAVLYGAGMHYFVQKSGDEVHVLSPIV